MGRTMSTTNVKAFRETVEPYLPAPSPAAVAKISISLPADLVDLLRASAADGERA